MSCVVNPFVHAAGGASGAIVAVQEFDTPTSTGNFDVTTAALGGLTPKAVLLIASHHNAANDPGGTVNNCLGFGAADAAGNEWSFDSMSRNGLADTDTRRIGSQTIPLRVGDPTSGTVGVMQYAVTSATMIAGGVRLDFGTVDASVSFRCMAVFFAGPNLEAKAGTVSLGSAAATVDVNTVGFEPDVVIFGGLMTAHDNGSATNAHALLFGAGIADGTQRGHSQVEFDGLAAGDPRAYLSTAFAIHQLSSSGALSYTGTVGDFDANGFSIVMNASSAGDDVAYLALRGIHAALLDFTTRTTTGQQALTGTGFAPIAAIAGLSTVTAVDTLPSSASDDYDGFSVGAFDGNEEWCVTGRSNSGSATTDTSNRLQAHALIGSNSSTSGAILADLVSFDEDGLTLDYTTVEATARKGWLLAFG